MFDTHLGHTSGEGIIPPDSNLPQNNAAPPANEEPAVYLAAAPEVANADTTIYQDVPANAWYAEAVAYCQTNDLMAGTDATHFTPRGSLTESMASAWAGTAEDYQPDAPVTREKLAYLLWLRAGSPASTVPLPYADTGQISEWAVPAAAWANEAGLMTGKPGALLDPLAAVTRAEVATVLMRRDLGYAAPASAVGKQVVDASLGASGITAAEDGSLMVTDLYNKKVWRVNEGRASVYAGEDTVKSVGGRPQGGYEDGALLKSAFRSPWAIAPYRDGWAVTDADNNALRLLSGDKVETITRSLSHPTGLAADGAGSLYISDTFSGIIRKLDANGTLTIAASGLNDPMGLCWKNGVLYIAETGANRVSKLEGGKVSAIAGSGEAGSADGPAETASFNGPTAVAVSEDGTVYVSDTGSSAIRRIQDGAVSTLAARDYAAGDLRLIDPAGLLLQNDTVLVCDTFAQTILGYQLD